MLVRQAAFENQGKMLKGALHCHTTRSDGKGEPAEVIRLHKAHGYDFMALTDHNYYNFRNYAPETNMTIIPGMEIDSGLTGNSGMCLHCVVIGPENGNGYRQDETIPSIPVYDQYEFQPRLDAAHERNNLTIYCHPEWSRTSARAFEGLKGNFAMELWNTGCVYTCDMDENNEVIWDELLVQGQKIYGVCTDDGHEMTDHCQGFVRVNAENNVSSILKSLSEGKFYASTGPEIYDFYIEDGFAVVKCSPARWVNFSCGIYPASIVCENGLMTEARCRIDGDEPFMRATVMNQEGRRAFTNPIFLK